jgi:uroporphyrinogen III methyltransferase/synthase
VELPAIAIAAPADGGEALRAAAERVRGYDWVVFTSANAATRFLDAVGDARRFGYARIAAIGPGTAEALAERYLTPDLVPPRSISESLLEAMPDGPGRVLIPQAAVARDVLPVGLREKAWEVEVVEAYRTEPTRPPDAALEAASSADAITFTSSSTVTNFMALGVAPPPVVVCIGPITAKTATEHGLTVDAVADEHTVDGLLSALRRTLER